ncbi:hypothetical protein ID866_6387 [Astraeus odoratus]|nr:hypothetical protein ID866_6387 [Astraeus odoratus]
MDLSDQRALVEELEGILRRRANKDKVVAATTAPPPLTPVPLTPQEGQSRNTSMSPVPRPPVLPGNSHPLEVAVESADEGLSSDSEEESDQGTPSTKRPTTVAESYGDDVLEAVIRGPAPRRGLSSMWKELREEEEEKEKVQLEEEDCARQQRGHTSQRLSRSSQETGGETSESLRDSVTGDGDIPGESSSGAKFATQGQLPQQADEGGYGERIPLEQCDTKQTTIQKESKLVTVVEESPCNETGESSSSGNSAGDDDVDPIEPAEELAYPSEGHFSDVDPIEPNTPASDIEKIIVLVNHSTPKYPVSKRMKTRGGAVLDDAELPVPVSTLISEAKDMITPLPEQRGPRKKVNGLSSSQEVIRTRRARSSDPLSSTAPVPCVSNDKEKGDSTPVMLQGKTPKSIIKSMLNGKEKKIAAPSTRTSSLVAWETMREPTPSVQSDELAPSSPQREDILTSAVGKSSEITNDPESNSDTNSDDDDTDAEDVQPRKGKEPLFDLTASQIPFPYSQYSTPAVSSLQSSINPEDRGKEVKQPPRKRTLGKNGVGTYRSLTELASEASSLFSPSLPTTAGKGTTDNRGPKKNALDTESEDSSSSSESDDPTGSTHIPRGRRASSVLPSKKRRGLLDGL